MEESLPANLRPPKIAGDVTVAPYLESMGARERWRVSFADRIHFLTDRATALRIRALAIASGEKSTYGDVHFIYKCEMGLSAEPLLPFVQWCEAHRQRLEQLTETPDNHTLTFRYRLFRSSICERIGEVLSWLFVPSTMVALVCISLMAVLINLLYRIPSGGASICGAIVIALVGVLFHEFGHTTACVRYRAKQGGIGVGLYWIWPVFFADVRGSWVLTARQRLQVSLGGLYFQSIYVTLLALAGIATGSPTVAVAIYITMLLMGNTLNPVLKYDGYWILSDWLNVTNLHTQIAAHLKALCQPRRSDWRVLVQSRMTLVLAAFTLFALAFSWFVFRSLIAASASTMTELSNAVGSMRHLFVVGSPTHAALATGLIKLGYALLQIAFVVMGLIMFGVRSARAMLSFASTALRKT
ncbi:MAG: hypothetical protein KGH90_00540 [Xanthomonadaceae bacterium]|jgi:putative peptide zinc metalloprotease protein|nr:hypothetical protein [Xanthomonadaceae bacterium]